MLHIFNRVFQMVLILACLSVVLFGLLSAMPGNPVDMLVTSNPRVKPEDIVRLKKLRGLDKPWYVQYVRWVWGYNDPHRPVSIGEFEVLESEIENSAQVDLSRKLRNPNTKLSYLEIKEALLSDNKKYENLLNEALSKLKVKELDAASNLKKAESLIEFVAAHDEDAYELLHEKASAKGLSQIEIKPLFGAKYDNFKLSQKFESPGDHLIYFIAKNPEGLETVGAAPVFVNSSSDSKVKNKNLKISFISSKIIDDPEKFKVDLNKFVFRESARVASLDDAGDEEVRAHKNKLNLNYKLLNNSPGQIDSNGIYTVRFKDPGQTAIFFEVRDEKNNAAKAAFSVEHGPMPDEERFNNGFLYAFAGDTGALGFSNTYKRPVWELLSGESVVCGDGKMGPGETCDDGNVRSGDGCSSGCHVAGLSGMSKLDAEISALFVGSGRVGNTLALMLPAILISLLLAIPIGMLSAYRQYSWLDYIVNFLAFIGISLPVFWFAIMLMYVFAENLQWFPAGGVQTPGIYEDGFWAILADRWYHAILPTMVLSIAYTGRWLRYMRASMLEVLPSDYIRTARAKGLSERVVIMKHAFRNALIPVVTVLTLSIPALFGGAVLTETVFSWPGIGRLQYDAVMNSDYYVAIVVFLISAALVMFGNLLADMMYVLVDPRIRKG